MTIVLDTLRDDDLDWLLAEHIHAYTQSDGFDDSFGILVEQVLGEFEATHDPTCETAIVARDDRTDPPTRLGSVFCVRKDMTTAQLRLFYLVPNARGLGLGRRLVQEVMQFARQSGYTRMVLWTHESHKAARALYAKTGWTLLENTPMQSFGVDVVRQHWEIAL